jgi:hypothetical protein
MADAVKTYAAIVSVGGDNQARDQLLVQLFADVDTALRRADTLQLRFSDYVEYRHYTQAKQSFGEIKGKDLPDDYFSARAGANVNMAASHYGLEVIATDADIVPGYVVAHLPDDWTPAAKDEFPATYPDYEAGELPPIQVVLDKIARITLDLATAQTEESRKRHTAEYVRYRNLFAHIHSTGVTHSIGEVHGTGTRRATSVADYFYLVGQCGFLPYMAPTGLGQLYASASEETDRRMRRAIVNQFVNFTATIGLDEVLVYRRGGKLETVKTDMNTMESLDTAAGADGGTWRDLAREHDALTVLLKAQGRLQYVLGDSTQKPVEYNAFVGEFIGLATSTASRVINLLRRAGRGALPTDIARPKPPAIDYKFGDAADLAHLVWDIYLTHLTYVVWFLFNDADTPPSYTTIENMLIEVRTAATEAVSTLDTVSRGAAAGSSDSAGTALGIFD